MLLGKQQAIDTWRSNWQIQKASTTGVRVIGEFGKISDGTWEGPLSLHLGNEGEYPPLRL